MLPMIFILTGFILGNERRWGQAPLLHRQDGSGDARKLIAKTIKRRKESGERVAKPEADSKYCLAKVYKTSKGQKGEAERLIANSGIRMYLDRRIRRRRRLLSGWTLHTMTLARAG